MCASQVFSIQSSEIKEKNRDGGPREDDYILNFARLRTSKNNISYQCNLIINNVIKERPFYFYFLNFIGGKAIFKTKK